MCIAAWIWLNHPLYPLFLLFNRDEVHGRPTNPVAWWSWGNQMILGGRDVQGGGTWLACSRNGRVAFLTNIRERHRISDPRSRGELSCKFLESSMSPLEFAKHTIKEENYNGFNLIVADVYLKSMVYICNRPYREPSIQEVSPGLHVLANAKLGTPLLKIERLRKSFQELLNRYGDAEISGEDILEQLMNDRERAGIEFPLQCGWDPDWEFKISSSFVEAENNQGVYGTRSQVALSLKANGEGSLYERYLEENSWKEHTVHYQIENL